DGIREQRPERDARGRARRRGQQHVGVATPELRVGLQRRVPAERFRAADVRGERVDGARIEPIETEARDLHAGRPIDCAKRSMRSRLSLWLSLRKSKISSLTPRRAKVSMSSRI